MFLHEGLGSAAQWRDFPARLAEATGHGALVYSRRGYGASAPLERAFDAKFMHHEALVVLPELLAAYGVSDPILVGHSDGASIALIHAAAGNRVRALALEAPHVFVEPITVASIAATRERFETTDLAERMRRYHGANTEPTFRAWTDVWLSDEFRAWDIRDGLDRIDCPVLVVQGKDDEYGTLAQVREIESRVADARSVVLDRCGHAPHRDRPEATLEAMRDFVLGLGKPRA